MAPSTNNKELSVNLEDGGLSGVGAGMNIPGIMAVAGGCLIHIVYGTLYCWGNWQSYTAAHMKNYNGEFNPAMAKRADTLQILALTIVFQAIAMPFGAPLTAKFGPGVVVLGAGCCCFLGAFLASFADSLGLFTILYAGILGGGIGVGYTAPLVCGYKHFPNSKGLISGLILGSFGVGGFIFNYVGSAMFNPDGLVADKATKLYPASVTEGFSGQLRSLSFIYLVVTLIAAPLIRLPKSEARAVAAAAPAMSVAEAIKTPTFWIMWVAIFASAQGGLYVSTSWKSIALEEEALSDDSYLAQVGAIGSLANGLMRPLWGALYDRIGFKRGLSIIAAIEIVLLFCFTYFTSSTSLYLIAVLISYSALAGNFTLAPAEVYKVFGNAAVYGVLYTSFAGAGILGPKIANKVADILSFGDDSKIEGVAFTFLSLMAIFSLTMVQFHKGSDQ